MYEVQFPDDESADLPYEWKLRLLILFSGFGNVTILIGSSAIPCFLTTPPPPRSPDHVVKYLTLSRFTTS